MFWKKGREDTKNILLSIFNQRKTISPYFKPSDLESISLTTEIKFDVCISTLSSSPSEHRRSALRISSLYNGCLKSTDNYRCRRQEEETKSSRIKQGQLLTVQIKTSISVTKLKSSIQLNWIWGFSHVFTSFLLFSSKSRFSPSHSLLLFKDLVLRSSLALCIHVSTLLLLDTLLQAHLTVTLRADLAFPPCLGSDGIQVLNYFVCFYNIKRMPLSNSLFSLTLISWRAHSATAITHPTFPGLRNEIAFFHSPGLCTPQNIVSGEQGHDNNVWVKIHSFFLFLFFPVMLLKFGLKVTLARSWTQKPWDVEELLAHPVLFTAKPKLSCSAFG